MSQQKEHVETFGDHWVVKEHHMHTGAKQNHLNPGGRETEMEISGPDHHMNSF